LAEYFRPCSCTLHSGTSLQQTLLGDNSGSGELTFYVVQFLGATSL
jgi:hypothetical protein